MEIAQFFKMPVNLTQFVFERCLNVYARGCVLCRELVCGFFDRLTFVLSGRRSRSAEARGSAVRRQALRQRIE